MNFVERANFNRLKRYVNKNSDFSQYMCPPFSSTSLSSFPSLPFTHFRNFRLLPRLLNQHGSFKQRGEGLFPDGYDSHLIEG
jgi:hypothetical protein